MFINDIIKILVRNTIKSNLISHLIEYAARK